MSPFQIDRKPTEDPEIGKSREIVIPKTVVFGIFALVLIPFSMYSGLLNRGYESKTISFSNFSKVTQGSSFGSKRMFLRKGQTFTADYDVEIERGGLYIRLRKYFAPFNTPAVGLVKVERSGRGQLRVPVDETGVYQLSIRGAPDRDGYQLSYNISWKTE